MTHHQARSAREAESPRKHARGGVRLPQLSEGRTTPVLEPIPTKGEANPATQESVPLKEFYLFLKFPEEIRCNIWKIFCSDWGLFQLRLPRQHRLLDISTPSQSLQESILFLSTPESASLSTLTTHLPSCSSYREKLNQKQKPPTNWFSSTIER